MFAYCLRLAARFARSLPPDTRARTERAAIRAASDALVKRIEMLVDAVSV